ncbi:MAG TPA: NDP-sugar synthase [Polyangia bacterium]|nr:NDP-sugar synthase [Polyangia bacterium]
MLLAAGRSTRLGELGTVLPKPLVPICGYPAITFALALCRRAGLTDVVVNLHHHGELIRQELGDGAAHGISIRYSDEPELLGTGGGIAKARPLFRPGPVLVMNGKVVADIDLARVVAAHQAAPSGTAATMVLRQDPNLDQWSPVGVDDTGRVVSLRRQRSDHTPVGSISDRMFTGIHILEPALLDRLPPTGVSDVIGEAYIPALLAGARIQSLTMTGYFAEHSTPERYLDGNLALLRNPALVPTPPGPLVGIDPAASVHPRARILMPVRIAPGAVIEEGATVGPLAVIGSGARVLAGAVVQRSVLWPGTLAGGEVREQVVTTSPGAVREGES